MNDLETMLREAVPDGPPLGFDPGELADRAAKQARRRTGLAALLGTVLAIGAVVFAVLPGGPFDRPAPATPSPDEEFRRIVRHLTTVLDGLFPGARYVHVGGGDTGSRYQVSVQAVYVDSAGHPGNFTVTIQHFAGSAPSWWSKSVVCDPGWPDMAPNGERSADEQLRCDRMPQPDGSIVVIGESGYFAADGAAHVHLIKNNGLNGQLYRPDGTTVTVWGAGGDRTVTDSAPLTEQQLTKLLTDPAFTLQ